MTSIDSTRLDSTSFDATRLDSTPLGMLLRGSCVHAWSSIHVVASSSSLSMSSLCISSLDHPVFSEWLTEHPVNLTRLSPRPSSSRSVREFYSSLHGAWVAHSERHACVRSCALGRQCAGWRRHEATRVYPSFNRVGWHCHEMRLPHGPAAAARELKPHLAHCGGVWLSSRSGRSCIQLVVACGGPRLTSMPKSRRRYRQAIGNARSRGSARGAPGWPRS